MTLRHKHIMLKLLCSVQLKKINWNKTELAALCNNQLNIFRRTLLSGITRFQLNVPFNTWHNYDITDSDFINPEQVYTVIALWKPNMIFPWPLMGISDWCQPGMTTWLKGHLVTSCGSVSGPCAGPRRASSGKPTHYLHILIRPGRNENHQISITYQ